MPELYDDRGRNGEAAVVDGAGTQGRSLRGSEDRLAFALEVAELGQWDLDLVDHTAYRNLRHDQIFGYSRLLPEWTYEKFLEHVVPEDRPGVDRAFQEALEKRNDWHFECRIRRADGPIRWISARGRIWRSADGDLQRMLGTVADITEQKEREELIRRSEQRFREMADAAPAVLWVTDAEGACTFLSRGWYDFTGQQEGTGLGDGWLHAIHAEDREEVNATFRKANAAHEPFRVDFRLRGYDGAYRWVIGAGQPRKGMDGSYEGFVGSVIDITERKEAEQARERAMKELSEERALFETVLRQMPAGVIVAAHPSGELVLANKQVEEILKHPFIEAEGIAQYANYEVFKADGSPYELSEYPMVRALATGEVVIREEVVYQLGDGSRATLLVNASPVLDGEGETVAGIVTFIDITERIAAEQERTRLHAELEAERARLEAVLRSMPLGLLIAEAPSGRLIMGNDYVERIWRHPYIASDDIDGYEAYRGYHPDGRPYGVSEWPLARIVRTGEAVHNEEIEILRGDGTRGTISVSGAPVRDAAGDVVAGVAIFEDITTRKQAEASLKELNDTLERRVEDRTAALVEANEKMEEVNVALRHRNRELQEFAYVASHDLQEPLRKISAFADLMRIDYGNRLDDDGVGYLDRMQQAATRMSTLISDLLSYSRVMTRGRPFGKLDLHDVIDGVLQDLHIQLEESRGTVVTSDIPTIEADATQMRQLFQNVISNALKFRREGVPPRIEITAERVSGAAGGSPRCVIRVKDNGIGFEQQYADKIFMPFQRLHGRTAYAGTGIGLAICRRIAERHGGTIYAEGLRDKGATVVIELPVHPPALDDWSEVTTVDEEP